MSYLGRPSPFNHFQDKSLDETKKKHANINLRKRKMPGTLALNETDAGCSLIQHGEALSTFSAFIYESLGSPDSIRMLNVFSGALDEPIEIILYPAILSDMQDCLALSYEWGRSSRSNPILCAGKMLNVTENLFVLLKQFRASEEARPLWIDALCQYYLFNLLSALD